MSGDVWVVEKMDADDLESHEVLGVCGSVIAVDELVQSDAEFQEATTINRSTHPQGWTLEALKDDTTFTYVVTRHEVRR